MSNGYSTSKGISNAKILQDSKSVFHMLHVFPQRDIDCSASGKYNAGGLFTGFSAVTSDSSLLWVRQEN